MSANPSAQAGGLACRAGSRDNTFASPAACSLCMIQARASFSGPAFDTGEFQQVTADQGCARQDRAAVSTPRSELRGVTLGALFKD